MKTLWMALKCRIMNFGDIIDVLSSRVISTAEHNKIILILNTMKVEETVSASNTIFGIDINGVKCFKS